MQGLGGSGKASGVNDCNEGSQQVEVEQWVRWHLREGAFELNDSHQST
jgi:hypothetical protein